MAKKAAATVMNVALVSTGIAALDAEVLSVAEGGLIVKYKKPRSSKYATRFIPVKQIAGVVTESDEGTFEGMVGTSCTFYLKGEHQEIDNASGEVSVTEEGYITVALEDGGVFMVADDMMESVGEDDSEAPAKSKKAPAKKAAPKKGKKVVEEDDDEEFEEDDEEEEAPKKKGKKAAPKKGKKVVEEEDDEEFEEEEDEDEDDEEEEAPKKKGKKAAPKKGKKVVEEDDDDDDFDFED